ncbi:MAG TPA: NAD(P)H-hydrate dehydratase [Opitutales bacterium]|nr:NAD(P)H-hydrate dehydratase [Opitutales bacterium]
MLKEASHPVISCAEAAELEKRLLKNEPEREWQAMAAAGEKLGRAVLRDFREIGELPDRPKILILAGKGHNTGDAFLAACEIVRVRPEADVDLLFVFSESDLNLLARKSLDTLLAATERVRRFSFEEREACKGFYEICFDGIFGMNFRPPFRGETGKIIEWANENVSAALRASVDLPSGLGDDSEAIAFRADFSYMTGSSKLPLFQAENAKWTGRLRYLDLGFFDKDNYEEADKRVLLPEILSPLRRLRDPLGYKGRYGHLLLVGGSRRTPGAILMSAMAAAQSGVGLLTAAVPESLVPSFAAAVPEVMWIGCPETDDGGLALDSLFEILRACETATAMMIGPGIGTETETQALLQEVVREADLPMVIDAEALQPDLLKRISKRKSMRGKVAVTPHAGEFLRICGVNFAEKGERALLAYAKETEFLVLLKGPPFTRICDGKRIYYALQGGPVLARGGSGDILAGLAGSLLARMPDQLHLAVERALVWHGLAADRLAREFGHEAVRTTQLLDSLAKVIREDLRL